MEPTPAGKTLRLGLLLSGLAGLALAKQTYIFDELAWTKQSWTDMKLRFPIEGLLREEDFGSYEAISSKGTYSKSSLSQALEEGQVQQRYCSMLACDSHAIRILISQRAGAELRVSD